MGVDRRQFLKIAGLSTLAGLGGKTAFELLAPGDVEAALPLMKAKRWAMVVDMRRLNEEAMKKLQKACHYAHNVPDFGDPKVEIKWIWAEEFKHAFPDHENEYVPEKVAHEKVLLLCNHCSNPPCCRVCPTGATWQREDGIVMMDWHRCIGCRFCMAGCPYGSRSFNWGDPRKAPKALNPDFPTNPEFPTRSKGVVEKCTFCDERLAKGLLPACVEAADKIGKDLLIFGDLADPDSNVRQALGKHFTIRRKPELGTSPNIYYIV
ncbi:MAG: 4Fe-4S dicluster domain-containing protein [Desulfatiglandaceae bacterium]|jgi:Fe-S-cluster-containing dehydrogenase component